MFPIFAGASLISALWLLATPIEESPAERSSSMGEVFSVLRDRKIRLLFLGIVAIVGIDVGLNTLAPKLLIERCGMPLESAGYGSSVYFFCRVIGAFTGTLLLTRLSDRTYYFSHILLGIAVLGALYFAHSRYAILIALGTEGFAFSSIFAVIYSQALKHMPARANEISGLMITGVFGGAVVPPLMGLLTDAVGSQAGSLAVLTLFALYLLGCGLMIRSEKTENHVSAR
jgi:FHS family L-fucose permease-like MFS transporter